MGEQLNAPAFVAFYGVLQLQARTLDPIARDFEARTGLAVSWYEVLSCLQGSPEGARMNELADTLLISRGGATKLVARLEDAGYVERITPKSDRRATYAKLTPAGGLAVNDAHPIQLELVQEHFGQYLSDDDLAQLTRISCKLLKAIDAECDWLDRLATEQAAPAESMGPVAT